MSVPVSLIEALREAAMPGTHKLPAASFQAVLKGQGLAFGHPTVDALMLKSRIDEAGLVDVSAAVAEADAYAPQPYSLPTYGAPAPANANPAPRFGSPLPVDTGATSQIQRVRAHTKDIAARLADLELCRISVPAFRAALEDMGIVETPEAARLLRQSSVPAFAALYRALQADSTGVAVRGGTLKLLPYR